MRSFRYTMWMPAVALLAVLAVSAVPTPAAAQNCEVPLFVKQSLGGANVMIVADNSGSMNEAEVHPDYDASITWSGNFNTDSVYYVGSDGYRTPRSFSSYYPSSPSVYMVNSDNGQSGRYRGNYLNWLFFHATDQQRQFAPAYTRIQVLKAVLTSIINRSTQLEFGLTIFNYDNGGKVVAPCGTDNATLVNTIQNITANTWTPLGETMEDVLDYFADDGVDAPIQAACEYNFCLVVTDGLPTQDTNVSSYLHDADNDGRDPGNCASIGAPYTESNYCSDHFDDVAYWMAHNDLRNDLDEDQNVFTYVVGFNLDAPILSDAADNGDGLYFVADSAVELFLSIEYALQDILRRISAGSAVAVVSTERGTDDRLYRGKFMPIDWTGFLECYALPYEDGDQPVWEAGQILAQRSYTSRAIFTAIGEDVYDFTAAQADQLWKAMGAVDENQAADLIDWGRGRSVLGYRYRQDWVLGDIIHSTPVVVGAPANFQATQAYQDFYDAHENRRKTVYVGANDGMLHAFDALDGEETWAFVPEFSLPEFATMADSGYCHTYTCDQTVTVSDIKVGNTWRTVLVSGGGRGGAGIFALDVTDPYSPQVMWQQNLPNGKSFTSEVQIVSIDNEAVALVGSGLDTDYGEAFLYAYEVATGDLLGEIELSDIPGRNKASRPEPVDVDLDGQTDVVYIADLAGEVYRIDVTGSANPGSWDVTTLYSGDREITANPVAAYGENGDVNVYFGTGAYLDDNDLTTDEQQYFLCIYDRQTGASSTMSDLTNQTGGTAEIGNDSGWYVRLWEQEGERVTEQCVVVAKTVIFTSYAPSMDACVAGGTSYLYQMDYQDGGKTDKQEEEGEDRSTSIGDGIASYPVVDLTSGQVVVQSSDASITVEDIAAAYLRLEVRSWQEDYDHVIDVGDPQVP